MRGAATVDQRRIRRRAGVRVHALQRIDQHAGDVAPGAQDAQRLLGHVVQRVGLVRRHGIADARLHVAPPAVIGAAESHEVRPPRVIARQPDRLHHRLGARHVERHLVEAGNLLKPFDVAGDDRVVGAEHRPEIAHALLAARHALLVEVIAEKIDAVGSGEVVEAVAVEIGDRHAGGRLDERTGRKVLTHVPAELERHPVGVGELQVGDAVFDFGGERARCSA